MNYQIKSNAVLKQNRTEAEKQKVGISRRLAIREKEAQPGAKKEAEDALMPIASR